MTVDGFVALSDCSSGNKIKKQANGSRDIKTIRISKFKIFKKRKREEVCKSCCIDGDEDETRLHYQYLLDGR
jgi:hypothetical protein